MRKKDGITALFDALIFLAIASVVSAALLSAFNGGGHGPDEDEQARLEAAHLVLLRSTVEDSEGNAHTLEELFKLTKPEKGMYEGRIEETLNLLLPGRAWRWTVQFGDIQSGYGSPTAPGPGEEIYCSLVRASLNGEDVVFRLEAWSV